MFDSLVPSRIPEQAQALRERERVRALARAGLLGLTLPPEYGGQGLGPFARFVVVEELLAVLREMSIGCTGLLAAGESPVVEASIVRDLGTGFEQSIPALIAEDLGAHPAEPLSPELARTLHYVSQICPSLSLRGGTREILRGIIARGLGLR